MRGWLKGVLLASFVFAASWIGAVSYWRMSNRMPSTLDLFAWMAVLPVGVLLAVWIGRRVAAARAAPAPSAPAADAAAAAPAPSSLPALTILASSIRTPHGLAAAELAQAIGAGSARAALDPELVDDEGYPILSARADAAVEEEIKDDIHTWRVGAALEDPQWTPEQWRALALGSAVAKDLLLLAGGHPQLLAAPNGPAARPPLLRIHAGLTPDWNEAQRAALDAWLSTLAVRAGWPAERVQVDSLPVPTPDVLARLATHAATRAEPVFALVLAFGSRIGEEGVGDLAMNGALFTSANQQGLVPGEAAAGLLLGDDGQAALFDPAAPRLQLASAALGAQEAGRRKPDPALLSSLAATLLPGPQDAATVSAIFADTGHHSARLVELMTFAGQAAPQLDLASDVKAVGSACGYCGEAPFLAALALAHQHALDTAGAALCVGNEDPLQRTAALVRPAAALS